jgi:phenylacetate-CoA ligase
MALDFKPSDFAYPVSIMKLRATFEKTQWFSMEELTLYQERLLRGVIEQAYWHVPYYRQLFDRMGLKPQDIRCLADLQKLPVLTKQTLLNEFESLQADNRKTFRPKTVCTSGTAGRQVQFLVDRPSNVLEFVYYWRYWNWAGYRLGTCFAEFSSVFFRDKRERPSTYFQRTTNRLLLNSTRISAATVETYVTALRKRRPRFLKGLPSALYYFCLFLRERGIDNLQFKAVFSTGEKLLPRYRNTIEGALGCKVYDSYGQMERTVAASECPLGGLHLNSDYGILELAEHEGVVSAGYSTSGSRASRRGKVLGTSLYCYSMPLLRYEVGDLIEINPQQVCPCGRQFPLVQSIDGRDSDVIITPEGEVITAAFLILEEIPEIIAGQLSQESVEEVRLIIVPTSRFSDAHEQQSLSMLRKMVGPALKLTVERRPTVASLRGPNGKLRPVISKIRAFPASTAGQETSDVL